MCGKRSVRLTHQMNNVGARKLLKIVEILKGLGFLTVIAIAVTIRLNPNR